MLAVKKINNNVAICKDRDNNELIALGKGIGFGKFPREINLNEIERTFYSIDKSHYTLIKELPSSVLSFSGEIIEIATNELPYNINPNLIISLADHINFAMERARKKIVVKMPLAYDVEQTYPAEYRIGKYILNRILKEFNISLPVSEAAGMALHFINGKAEQGIVETSKQDIQIIEEITEIIEKHFGITINRKTFNYSRYATHMQYLLQRIKKNSEIKSENKQLYQVLAKEFPNIVECVNKISVYLEKEKEWILSDEEKLYLILHINRILVREN